MTKFETLLTIIGGCLIANAIQVFIVYFVKKIDVLDLMVSLMQKLTLIFVFVLADII
jgi:hypothetical protein